MKKAALSILISALLFLSSCIAYADTYTVQSGDFLWRISNSKNVSINDIKMLNDLKSDTIYVGQKLLISYDYKVVYGDSLFKISQKFMTTIDGIKTYNNLKSDSLLVGQVLKIPPNTKNISMLRNTQTVVDQKPYVTYTTYYVNKGDTVWNIALKFGIPTEEVNKANSFNQSSVLNIGQAIKIPVHYVPVISTPGPQYGEMLDWWTQARYVLPIGKVFKIIDFKTGKSFMAKRTTGAYHSDTEPLTAKDSAIMKEIWGGWSWISRPVIIEVDGRKIAASANGMPHAGLDSKPSDIVVSNRSGDFLTGPNFDYIKGNDFDGHFCLHFLNSWCHNTSAPDKTHQSDIHIAAGK